MIPITVVRTLAYPEFGLHLDVVVWGEYDEKPSFRPTGYDVYWYDVYYYLGVGDLPII